MRWLAVLLVVEAAACSDAPARVTDAPIDTAADPCQACSPGELCVARYGGTCQRAIGCVARTVSCPGNACSAACEAAYCASPYQCHTRTACGGEPPIAFTCYGP